MKATVIILNSIKQNGLIFSIFLIALCFFGLTTASAQEEVKVETPKPKVVIAPTPTRMPFPRRVPAPKRIVVNESSMPAEKTIAVDPKVNITLCVTEGNVKINGWDREEIRAFVSEGSEVGFKVAQKSAKTGSPVWVHVLGYDPQKTKEIDPDKCLSGSEIELDVPRGTVVNLMSRESEINIEAVAKVRVQNGGGDIFLNSVSQGVEAKTYQGGITVERSSGSVILETTSGNIVVLDVSPSEIGDIFKAKTNSGIITLNGVGHRQIETRSISGSTSYVGELLDGGQYGFGTQDGSIVLSVVPESCAKIVASTGFGTFDAEFPLRNRLRKEQIETAQIGDCQSNANINFTSYKGRILIKKKK